MSTEECPKSRVLVSSVGVVTSLGHTEGWIEGFSVTGRSPTSGTYTPRFTGKARNATESTDRSKNRDGTGVSVGL